MDDEQTPADDVHLLQRPIGWWLKEADARIDAAFASALRQQGVDRRGWQVLATLAGSSARRSDLAAALASFDEPAAVESVVEDLRGRGWVGEPGGALGLTPAGRAAHERLAQQVDRVRSRVAAALPGDEYVTLVRLLARLVAGLPQPPP